MRYTVFTVRLEDETGGTIDSDALDGQHADAFIGELVTVQLVDGDGMPIEVEGRLVEVLEENAY